MPICNQISIKNITFAQILIVILTDEHARRLCPFVERVAANILASDSMIYALIVCSIVPILVIYPFIQKYFAKGVNVGGVKE